MIGKKIDGRKIASAGEKRLKKKIVDMERPPSLHTIFAGEDEGSKVYLGVKERGCKRVGIESKTHRFEEDVPQQELIEKIEGLNGDDSVDGILVQMPLPRGIEADVLISHIDPVKDVEGLHPSNLGVLLWGDERRPPCTPKGIITMLEAEGVKLKGKEVCVVSHSTIVGKPMALMLLNRDATVHVVHVHTTELAYHTRKSDILIVAAGVPRLIGPDEVRGGAVVIDVGMNRLESGELVGDVDYEEVKKVASKITPVPGGVGPTTVLSLLENTYDAAVSRRK